MPTGYTAAVQDGTTTELRDFALACARNFGALIHLRDEPWGTQTPRCLPPADTEYYDEQIAAARAVLAELPGLSAAECTARASVEHAEAVAALAERRAHRERIRRRYEAMLAQVWAWEVPDDLQGLRLFMAEQLASSIVHDCDDGWDGEPVEHTAETWRREKLQQAERDLGDFLGARRGQIETAEARQRWLDALWAALPDPRPAAGDAP